MSGVSSSSTKDVSDSDDDQMPGLVDVEAKPRNPIESKRDDEMPGLVDVEAKPRNPIESKRDDEPSMHPESGNCCDSFSTFKE